MALPGRFVCRQAGGYHVTSGTWRSLVACLHGAQEVPGSNPGVPTRLLSSTKCCYGSFSITNESMERPADARVMSSFASTDATGMTSINKRSSASVPRT